MKKNLDREALTRRDFIKGATAGAVGIATIGVLGACSPKVAETGDAAAETPAAAEPAASVSDGSPWYGTAPEIADADIVETVETEILICGAGHTGMISALVAASEGAKTLVIEKNPTVGTIRTYVGGVDTKAQLAAGVTFDRNALVADIARYGSNHVDQKLIRLWADESGETIDWLADQIAENGITHVAEYDTGTGYHGVYKCWPTHTKFMVPLKEGETPGPGVGGIEPFVNQKSQDLGAEFRFSTPLVKLLRDETSGKVTGAIAKNTDNKYIKINASKAVLICTGGYADDEALFTQLNPCAASVTTFKWVQPGNVGDGIKAGIWVGGVKDKHPAAMLFDRGICAPGTKGGSPYKLGGFMDILNMGSQPFLKVNMDGIRYTSESVPYDFSLYPCENEKNGVHVMLWDANYWQNMESFHTMGCSRMIPSTTEPATGEGMGKEMAEASIAGHLKAGLVQEANTIEELAAKLQLPADALKATVERYNQMAAAGVDDEYGKPAKDLIALETPPFRGATIGGWVLTTMDGLEINANMQVLDADRKPIEGLYAAGDTAGGFFAHNYPELAVGIACGKSMTFGRHAILHALGK